MNAERVAISKYISILYRSGGSYLSKKFADYNIGTGQFTFLLHLSHNEGVTQEEMSCSLHIDKGTTTKALKKLEQEGYIFRQTDEKDKRAHRVYLTDKGKSIIGDIHKILDEWNNIITAGFTDEEKELSLKLLQRMAENKNNFFKKGEC
jgi:DNA-binding MarR family transcriptional regulator